MGRVRISMAWSKHWEGEILGFFEDCSCPLSSFLFSLQTDEFELY